MLHTSPTYTQLSEAQICASKPLLCAIGGGNATDLISSDYSDFYKPATDVLHTDVCSRLSSYIHF